MNERLIKLVEAQPQTKWRVEVVVGDRSVLSISDDSLFGKESFTEEEADAIRAAGENLLSFIGEKNPIRNEKPTGLCWDCEEEAVAGKLWCKKHGG